MKQIIKKLRKWVFSLQGKFIIVASTCIFIFTSVGSFLIISREESLYKRDILNQGSVLSEISRLTLTNVMVYKELGMMSKLDLTDYLDYFILNLMERDKRIRYVAIVDNNGLIISQSDSGEYGKICKDEATLRAISSLETIITDSNWRGEPIINIAAPLNISTKSWGGIRIGLSTKKAQESISSFKNEIAKLVIFFSIISLLIISIGAKVLARPVIKLSKIMDGIKSHGDLEVETQYVELKDRRDEIGELQKSFLWMLQRLREADREHKKTVEVLSQTEKMVAIGRLAAGVAHEINNPLSGMTLCFKNLMEADADNLTREKLVMAINDGLQKIKNIVGHLLDFSRMTVTEKTSVNLNNLINRLLVLLNYPASKKNIEIINDLSEDISEILIDENKMSQVFMNIMINAVQAMDDGGRLTIRTKADDGFCVVSIEDTGGGIAPDIMSHIFDPFFTTKGIGEGTGLGLSVSKGIVEQHGGMIEVDSEIGAGTTFRIKLPLV
ncbi:MAG: HAMP domain-containing protein [Nitrospiraceae bacterium]|nr:MAG: HAMP domain-containing protein [Nitrospiraceae bacterium]